MAERRSFSIELKVGETISIDRGRIVLTLLEKSGQRAKLGFEAEKVVPVNKVDVNFRPGAAQARKGISRT
jgi:sRNA-binding carbon storage regulator CsrA